MGDLGGKVREAICAAPPWFEALAVLTVAFGGFVLSSILAISHPEARVVSSDDLFRTALFEIGAAAAIASFLGLRGWSTSQLGFAKPSGTDLWHAAWLLVSAVILTVICEYLASAISGVELSPLVSFDQSSINPAVAVAFSAVNSAFEETFVCAYVISAWKGPDVWSAVGLSALVRLSYHLYQGAFAIATIFPFAIVLGWYFKSQRRLLPLVLTHAMLDIIALLTVRN